MTAEDESLVAEHVARNRAQSTSDKRHGGCDRYSNISISKIIWKGKELLTQIRLYTLRFICDYQLQVIEKCST